MFLIIDIKNTSRAVAHLCVAILTATVCGLLLIQPEWGVFPILFFLLCPFVMMQFPIRQSLIWIAVFTLSIGLIFISHMGILGLLALFVYAAGYMFFGVFGWLLHESEVSRAQTEQLLAELQDAHTKLQDYASRLEELTIAQERNRISREMHDTLGHRLTIASVQLEGAQRLVHSDPGKAEKMIATVREQVREGLSELRRTVAMLRSPLEQELPIEIALEKLVNQAADATGIQIHLSIGDCPSPLPGSHRQAVYRAAQEGLTNIQRHSNATEAWIRLDEPPGKVVLTISDNGQGIPPAEERSGFGLSGLQERSALLGGACYIDPRPGGGTQITFQLPLGE